MRRFPQPFLALQAQSREALAPALLDRAPFTVENFSFDLYRWAVACVSTRVNMIPSGETRNADDSPKLVRVMSDIQYIRVLRLDLLCNSRSLLQRL